MAHNLVLKTLNEMALDRFRLLNIQKECSNEPKDTNTKTTS